MSTILFGSVVFGPVHSRRLGVSLGVNLLPTDSKFCNFNCIYCECGWNPKGGKPRLPQRAEVQSQLVARLDAMRSKGERLDVITFAGNGEPTIHPDFEEIIDDTLAARDAHYPAARVVVLSNASMLDRASVSRALHRVDQVALKLDAPYDDLLQLINGPQMRLTVADVVARLRAFGHAYTLQTLFLRGEYRGQVVDNATPQAIEDWLAVVADLRPRDVMVYTIDRETPAQGLEKVSLDELRAIAARVEALGIGVQVSG